MSPEVQCQAWGIPYGDTFFSKHGLSLQLLGLQKDINDKSVQRAIVLHGANYISENGVRR
jgi:hypothetical protein